MDGSLGKILHLEEQVGNKGFIMLTLPHHNPSLRKVRKGTQDRETGGGDLKQRPQRSAAHRLVLVRCFPWKPEDSNLYPQSAHISGHSGTPFCKTRAPSTRWEVEICPESFRNSTRQPDLCMVDKRSWVKKVLVGT